MVAAPGPRRAALLRRDAPVPHTTGNHVIRITTRSRRPEQPQVGSKAKPVENDADGAPRRVPHAVPPGPATFSRTIDLGAVEVGRWLDCRTLPAPSGHIVCAIPATMIPDTFERLSRVWR